MRRSNCGLSVVLLLPIGACSRGASDPDVEAIVSAGKKPKLDAGGGTGGGGTGGSTGGSGGTGGMAGSDAGADAGPPPFLDACLLPGMIRADFIPYGTIDRFDEGATSPLALPFPFTFLGSSHTQYWVTANGELGFGGLTGGPAFGRVRCPMPDPQITKPIVFAYASDFMSAFDVCMATTGNAPNRKLEITWKNLRYYEIDGSGNGSSNVAFGATLTEGSSAITLRVHQASIQYANGDPAPIAAGAWATLGLQSGASAVSFSCQQPSAPAGSVFNHVP